MSMSTTENVLPTSSPRISIRQQETRYLIGSLLIVDTLVIIFSLVLSYIVRFKTGWWIFNPYGHENPTLYISLVSLLVPAHLLLYAVYGMYNRTNLLGGTTEYARLFNAATAGVIMVMFINFIDTNFIVARAWILMSWTLIISLGITARFLLRRFIYYQRRAGHFLERTLIIGANPEGLAVTQQLLEAPSSGAYILGFVDDYLPVGSEPLPSIPVVGRSSAFASLVQSLSIDTVIIANTAITRERLLGIYSALDALREVEVRLASGLFELLTTGVRVREEAYVPLIVLNKTRIIGAHYLIKTVVDYLIAGLSLICLVPFFLVIAIMIKRDSPGPIFYRRRVIGQGKRSFDAFKFRTLYVGGDHLLTPEQRAELAHAGKLKQDPRVTPVGQFLRRYSIDELPQLFNVLMGQMSLIGPRMITAEELARFGKWQYNLATVKPGLTGLWQIRGRSDLSYEERVRLDMHYIRNHSIWLDLHILILTIPALLSGRGAY